MSATDYELEVKYEIFNNRDGCKLTVSGDSDGLGLIEINDSETNFRLTLEPAAAQLLATAIRKCVADKETVVTP